MPARAAMAQRENWCRLAPPRVRKVGNRDRLRRVFAFAYIRMGLPAEKRDPNAPPVKKVIGRPFQKGNNANPGGRPKGLRQKALEADAATGGFNFYVSVINDPKARLSDRIECKKLVSAYSYGRPADKVLSGELGSEEDRVAAGLSDERILELLEKLEAEDPPANKP